MSDQTTYLKLNEDADFTVIIPTMATPRLIIPCVDSILRYATNGSKLHLVVSSNTDRKDENDASRFAVMASVEAYNANAETNVTLEWVEFGEPMGWTGAVNGALHAIEDCGVAPAVVIMNDDIIVTNGWLEKLEAALGTDKLFDFAQIAMEKAMGESGANARGICWDRSAEDYGKLGMVGPVSNSCAGIQKVGLPATRAPTEVLMTMKDGDLIEQFSATHEDARIGQVYHADFLSGFCTMYSRECLNDLIEEDLSGWWLLDPVFGLGGFDDNDVCVRAAMKGWTLGVAWDTYVHHLCHQTLQERYPEMARGMVNAGNYLKKWEKYTQRDQKLVGTYRVKVQSMQDLFLLKQSIHRHSALIDGVAILWTGNPSSVSTAWDFSRDALNEEDKVFLDGCATSYGDDAAIAALTQEWAKVFTPEGMPVNVGAWRGDFHEREERNRGIELAYELGPDWVISIDHDEVIEDRITRSHIERLMKHPNPSVGLYDFGWLNHWDSPRLFRTDNPWSFGYQTSMRGFRMWRVPEKGKRIIGAGLNADGLHCGNSPSTGVLSRRVSGVRFRHYGYIRDQDRRRKFSWYLENDPDPMEILTGNPQGYTHLVDEENISLTAYRADNGIGYTMLAHKKEQHLGLFRLADALYSLCDYMNVVWTSDEEVPQEIMEIVKAYGITLVYRRFQDDLAEVRNAGLADLRKNAPNGTGWCLTLDEDEGFESQWQDCVAIRRMAECTDSWAWMFQFRNYRNDGSHNISETSRMFRLEPRGIMKFHGRVHETIEKSLAFLRSEKIHPNVRFAPFTMEHHGLAGTNEQMQEKLNQYTKLLALNIEDDPLSCGSWVSLGLQFGNEGDFGSQERCFDQAIMLAGNAFLPFKEMGAFYMRKAHLMYKECEMRLAPAHPFYEIVKQLNTFMDRHSAPQPVSGTAAEGNPTTLPVDLDKLLACSQGAIDELIEKHEEAERVNGGGRIVQPNMQPMM